MSLLRPQTYHVSGSQSLHLLLWTQLGLTPQACVGYNVLGFLSVCLVQFQQLYPLADPL